MAYASKKKLGCYDFFLFFKNFFFDWESFFIVGLLQAAVSSCRIYPTNNLRWVF